MANLVAKAFSSATSSNKNKPDIFSTLIQQTLKVPKRTTSSSKEDSQTSEKQQNYESEESHRAHQQDNSEESATNSKQFHTKSPPTSNNDIFGLNLNAATVVTSMLRMVGFDAAKLGALAINALIMIASAVIFL